MLIFYFFPYFFSDAFDTDTGLQCKGKNNIVGIYLYVLNMAEHNRSQRDGFLTIQVIRNSQLKEYEFNKCMKRITEDLIDLVENGFIFPNGQKANVRVCQYRMDSLEKNKAMRLAENFSTSTFFSWASYITTDDRKQAKKLEDILPANFEKRTEESYKVS